MSDLIQHFLFQDTDMRGAIARIDSSYKQMLSNTNYSIEQNKLLADFAVAAILLASQLKFTGSISLQARSESGALVVAQCDDKLNYRAVVEGEAQSWEFAKVFEKGILALTLEPEKGQRYQGMVPLEKDNLAGCLSDYFLQSEQLPSWFYFYCENDTVAGFMLQALPAQICKDAEQREEDWQRVQHLADTLQPQELLHLEFEALLYRLYHEETVRIFDANTVRFYCSCSTEKMERALLQIGEAELRDIVQEQGKVETQCHFCHRQYAFNEAEIELLLQGKSSSH